MVVVREFIWNLRNTSHIARHGITPKEVVQVVITKHITRDTYKDRFLIIGETVEGRILAVILEKLPRQVFFLLLPGQPVERNATNTTSLSKGGEHQ